MMIPKTVATGASPNLSFSLMKELKRPNMTTMKHQPDTCALILGCVDLDDEIKRMRLTKGTEERIRQVRRRYFERREHHDLRVE